MPKFKCHLNIDCVIFNNFIHSIQINTIRRQNDMQIFDISFPKREITVTLRTSGSSFANSSSMRIFSSRSYIRLCPKLFVPPELSRIECRLRGANICQATYNDNAEEKPQSGKAENIENKRPICRSAEFACARERRDFRANIVTIGERLLFGRINIGV